MTVEAHPAHMIAPKNRHNIVFIEGGHLYFSEDYFMTLLSMES